MNVARTLIIAVGIVVPVWTAHHLRSDGGTPASDARQAPKKGLAVSIGLNAVDPAQYDGTWKGGCVACEADAKDMSDIASSQGFAASKLLGPKATRQAVIDAIKHAAGDLKTGDTFMLSFSGHGGQVQDMNGDEGDGQDETWCLYDGLLIDDELADLWTAFAPGVRILVFSDSCHSGTVARFQAYEAFLAADHALIPDHKLLAERFVALRSPASRPVADPVSPVRAMPDDVAARTFQAHRKFYEDLGKKAPPEPASEAKTVATVLLISGCQDTQLSLDGGPNGAFTAALRSVWNSGAFKGDYRRFHEAILGLMPPTQCPNYYLIGACNRAFEQERPFTH